MLFKVDELLQAILLRETTQQATPVFVASTDEVAGDADIKRSVAAITHYVNKAAIH